MEKNMETIVLGSRVTAETTNGELASTPPAYGLPEHSCQNHTNNHHTCMRLPGASSPASVDVSTERCWGIRATWGRSCFARVYTV